MKWSTTKRKLFDFFCQKLSYKAIPERNIGENIPEWLIHLVDLACCSGKCFLVMRSNENKHLLLVVCEWCDYLPVNIGLEYVDHDEGVTAGCSMSLYGDFERFHGFDVSKKDAVLKNITEMFKWVSDVIVRTADDDEVRQIYDGKLSIHDVMDTAFKEIDRTGIPF